MFGIRRKKKGLTEKRKEYYREKLAEVEQKLLAAKLAAMRLDYHNGELPEFEDTLTVTEGT